MLRSLWSLLSPFWWPPDASRNDAGALSHHIDTHTHHPQKKDSWKRIKENSRQLPQLSMAWYTMPYHIVCYIYRQATKNGVVQTQLQLQIQIHLDTRVEMPRQPNLVTHKSKKNKKSNKTSRNNRLLWSQDFLQRLFSTFLTAPCLYIVIYMYVHIYSYILAGQGKPQVSEVKRLRLVVLFCRRLGPDSVKEFLLSYSIWISKDCRTFPALHFVWFFFSNFYFLEPSAII